MNEVKELEEEILRHKELYYRGSPEISDEAYDDLERRLNEINPDSYVLKIVGTQPKSDLPKVQHSKKMLSLEKTYSYEDLIKWVNEKDVVSTIKLDGISCSLVYKNGLLSLGKTRGNGTLGENITSKCLWIPNLPKTISIKEEIEIRGEILCTYEDFKKLGGEMENLGLDKPTSPRNISAGLIGRKDHISLCKYLTFKAFDIMGGSLNLSFEEDKISLLEKENFLLAPFKFHKNGEGIKGLLNETYTLIKDGKFQLDGVVFTYNELSLHKKLGETAHHPRYKIAYKYKSDSKETRIEKIIWDISRNGIFTPVAIVEPVELSGAKITRVTLHNFGVVKENNLKKDDIIEITRSGEVIPKFLKVIKSSTEKFLFLENCTYCNTKLNVLEIRLVCPNDKCPGALKGQILNYIKKIGIDDISEKRLNLMIQKSLIRGIPDLYRLNKDDLLNLDKVKEKLASKLISSIENSKSIALVTFLSALGISGGAENKNEKIVSAGFSTVDDILSLKTEDLMKIEGFAERSSSDYINSLNTKKELIGELLLLGVKPIPYSFEVLETKKFDGLKFCITGTLTRKRSEIEKDIKENGGEAQKSVNKNTDFLVCNDLASSSSKMKKAKELNIKIITEKELENLLSE